MAEKTSLYVLLKTSSTPLWAKVAIIGALGYFIVPVDAIPDFLAGIGYVLIFPANLNKKEKERCKKILSKQPP